MIPTFNCGGFLGETLSSVLAQAPAKADMQIEVVDDHSTDDPKSVVSEIGQGRVGYFRQEKNVGHIKNFETCIQRARGRLVHLLHGDDLVRPGFYQKMQQAFEIEPAIGGAFCRCLFIDESGREQSIQAPEQSQSGIFENWLERLAEEQRVMTPAIVVRRDVYEAVGSFDSRLICAEDWEMWVRIAALYPIWYETEPLAAYRMHLQSNTGRHVRSGEDILYTYAAIDLFKNYLPPKMAARVVPRAKETYALSALRMARIMSRKCEWTTVRSQIKAALKGSHSPRVLFRLMRLAALCAAFQVKRGIGER
jgi:glycosyltransferase involved in cell wall biosynthesis